MSICQSWFGSSASNRVILFTGGRETRLIWCRTNTRRTVSLWTGRSSLSRINLAERCLPSSLHRTILRLSLSESFWLLLLLLSFKLSGPSSRYFFLYRNMLLFEHTSLSTASLVVIFPLISSKIMFFLTWLCSSCPCDLPLFVSSEDHIVWQFRCGKKVTV